MEDVDRSIVDRKNLQKIPEILKRPRSQKTDEHQLEVPTNILVTI